VSTPDVIVVGSGASATSAAFPLVEAGHRVLMLDVGNTDSRYAPLVPDARFSEIRHREPLQHRYFLGDEFEGVPFGRLRVGAQLTPPRQFIHRDTDRLTPVRTNTFVGLESLALGGLAAGWGAIAVQFDDRDMAGYPVGAKDLAPHYEVVSARVGISGARDDLLPFYGDTPTLQPALDLDSNGRAILLRYQARRGRLVRDGIHLGRPRLAVLSRDLGSRRGQRYHDMDYYIDQDRSVFRPAFAVEELSRYENFTYASPWLVERFRESTSRDGIAVDARHTGTGRVETFTARRLVLAAGTLGTARIVLRSFERYGTSVPIVSNPYTYVPCINLAAVGKAAIDDRHSLTQLAAIYAPHDATLPLAHAQIHSYRSLLLFKLAKEAPLPIPEAFRVMRELLNSFVILSIQHEDRPTAGKHCILQRDTRGGRDVLEIVYEQEPAIADRQARAEKVFLRALRTLGCWPIKRIRPGHGSSIHYAGTVPMTTEEREITATPDCRLRGTKTVYLADGSVLPYLPAKALTLTLMANADRVGSLVASGLR